MSSRTASTSYEIFGIATTPAPQDAVLRRHARLARPVEDDHVGALAALRAVVGLDHRLGFPLKFPADGTAGGGHHSVLTNGHVAALVPRALFGLPLLRVEVHAASLAGAHPRRVVLFPAVFLPPGDLRGARGMEFAIQLGLGLIDIAAGLWVHRFLQPPLLIVPHQLSQEALSEEVAPLAARPQRTLAHRSRGCLMARGFRQ
mmetsp:Transcript_49938/g.143544  ORF Transcript_49938/g.143544 Transcript_49938/m.143544 type:complete len:202 (-) Transcript_49938:614-1219(-)